MKGYQISYTPKDSHSRTLLNHTLFGRIIYRAYRGRKYAYYAPGFLDNIKFFRFSNGVIFAENLSEEQINILNIFGEIKIVPFEIDEMETKLLTGKEYWHKLADEKKLMMRERRTSKK